MTDRVGVAAAAQIVAQLGSDRLPGALCGMLRAVAPISHVVVFAYRGAARPLALFDDFPPDRKQIFVVQYQAGPYLLDPLYLATSRPEVEGLFRLKDLAPDRFYQGEYFRNYYIQTGLAEEIAFLVKLPMDVTLIFSLMQKDRAFSGREFRAFAGMVPLVNAAVRRHWADIWQRFAGPSATPQQPPPPGDLGRAFAQFGIAILTPREREVVEYTLKGHSAEATGAILNIAPGTVRIHRRNIYSKLGISSQGELFASFIGALSSAETSGP